MSRLCASNVIVTNEMHKNARFLELTFVVEGDVGEVIGVFIVIRKIVALDHYTEVPVKAGTVGLSHIEGAVIYYRGRLFVPLHNHGRYPNYGGRSR